MSQYNSALHPRKMAAGGVGDMNWLATSELCRSGCRCHTYGVGLQGSPDCRKTNSVKCNAKQAAGSWQALQGHVTGSEKLCICICKKRACDWGT